MSTATVLSISRFLLWTRSRRWTAAVLPGHLEGARHIGARLRGWPQFAVATGETSHWPLPGGSPRRWGFEGRGLGSVLARGALDAVHPVRLESGASAGEQGS